MKKKLRFWLCKRNKTYHVWDTATDKRERLRTCDKDTAQRLVQAKNDAEKPHAYNLALAKVHMAAADPMLSQQTWATVIDEFIARACRDSTKQRRELEFRQERFNDLRRIVLTETTPENIKAAIKSGGVFTNHFLRCVHNLAVGLGWLPWPIIASKLWPETAKKAKRGITKPSARSMTAVPPGHWGR